MPSQLHGLQAADIHTAIQRLLSGLVHNADASGAYLMPLADGRVIDTKGWDADAWEWTHGIGLAGLWAYHELTGSPQHLAAIESWFAARFAAGGTTKNINTMAVFRTLARVYDKTKNETYRPWLEAWADWALHDLPRTRYGGMAHVTYLEDNGQQLWADTLMMTALPLAEIGRVLGRPEYVDEARRQFLLHVQYLFDARTGLFFHGWEFGGAGVEGQQGHHFAGARWARGNAWLTMAIPDFLELLEENDRETGLLGRQEGKDDALRQHLLATLRAQCAALAPLQEPGSGLWRTLLDVPAAEGSYAEASATAGFAYGLLKGLRKRCLIPASRMESRSGEEEEKKEKEVYEETAVRAVKAVLANIDEKGELGRTSFGTGMGRDLQHYKDVPVTCMPYGQAMAVMALVEFLRVFI